MKKKKSSLKSKPKKAAAKKSAGNFISLDQKVWPVERDVLFRPDRLKYVRKLIKADGCVFCTAAQKKPDFETLCLKQSEHAMVVLNKYPYNPGHVMVLPKRHCGDMLELSDFEYTDLQNLLRETVQAVRQAYSPAGFNLGLNHGAVAGAGIPDHLHYHIVPRWSGDLNFFPLIAETKAVPESLEDAYQRLLSCLK